jgi:hypothetical protein
MFEAGASRGAIRLGVPQIVEATVQIDEMTVQIDVRSVSTRR